MSILNKIDLTVLIPTLNKKIETKLKLRQNQFLVNCNNEEKNCN